DLFDRLVGGKSPAAGDTLAPPADDLPLATLARVHHFVVAASAERALHRRPRAEVGKPEGLMTISCLVYRGPSRPERRSGESRGVASPRSVSRSSIISSAARANARPLPEKAMSARPIKVINTKEVSQARMPTAAAGTTATWRRSVNAFLTAA